MAYRPKSQQESNHNLNKQENPVGGARFTEKWGSTQGIALLPPRAKWLGTQHLGCSPDVSDPLTPLHPGAGLVQPPNVPRPVLSRPRVGQDAGSRHGLPEDRLQLVRQLLAAQRSDRFWGDLHARLTRSRTCHMMGQLMRWVRTLLHRRSRRSSKASARAA